MHPISISESLPDGARSETLAYDSGRQEGPSRSLARDRPA